MARLEKAGAGGKNIFPKIKKVIDKAGRACYNIVRRGKDAGVAQLVEQLICNQQVGGSSPSTSSTTFSGRTKE